MTYTLKFFGNDGEFEYTYWAFDSLTTLFRTPRLFGLSWTFDGDGLSSNTTEFEEPGVLGKWYVSLV